MGQTTFREWLAARVGDGGQVSRRELARRLADKYQGDAESHRRSIRRILDGERVPTQATRDAIQTVLDDFTAPTVEEEDADEGTRRERKVEAALSTLREIALGVRSVGRVG